MSTIRFVSPEHVDILRNYLGADSAGAVVLIYPEIQKKVTSLGIEDGDDVDYDFGGQGDLMVDIVSSPTHYFIGEMDPRANEPDDDTDEEE